MDTPKSRAYLRQLFQAGRIPTEEDFNTLIDSQLNAVDDQVTRRNDGKAGDSLCLGAGKNKTLVSFFSSLNNAVGEWSIRLDGNNKNLNISAGDNATAVLSLDPTGKLGIGTETPSVALDVNGDIAVANLQLKKDLNVAGKATVKSLTIPGLGTITDADSLRKLVNAPALGTNNPVTGDSGSEVVGAGTTVPSHNEIDAKREWQVVAGPFKGYQALQAIAWVDGGDNRSICHATAVCIDGDPSSNAIQQAQSYQGRPGAKISFRWNGTKTAYNLECRVRVNMPAGTKINYRIQSLL